MDMTSHGFYIAIAYGLSAVLLAAELIALLRRCRAQQPIEDGPPDTANREDTTP